MTESISRWQGISGRVCRLSIYEQDLGAQPSDGWPSWHTRTVAEEGETLHYEHLHTVSQVPEGLHGRLYLVPDLLSGSDYGGDTVSRSNYRVFVERYATPARDGIHEVHGGHGTYAVAIRLDLLRETEEGANYVMLQDLVGLDNYPLLDEEDLSYLESELADEAWESWAKWDFYREIRQRWPVDVDGEIDRGWFEELAQRANRYWHGEGGGGPSVTIELDDVADEVTLADLLASGLALEWDDPVAQTLWDAIHADGPPDQDDGRLCILADVLDGCADEEAPLRPGRTE